MKNCKPLRLAELFGEAELERTFVVGQPPFSGALDDKSALIAIMEPRSR